MSGDLKQIIRHEYLKCAKDPAHFMKKYCNIQHPQRAITWIINAVAATPPTNPTQGL